jgi:hypothetical protein
MRFAHIGATEEQLWRWFQYPDTDFEAEFRFITNDEWATVMRKYRIAQDRPDEEGLKRHIAQHWFRAFRNAVGANGEPLDNTPEVRREMLRDPEFFRWATELLTATAKWREEGNADSGSA